MYAVYEFRTNEQGIMQIVPAQNNILDANLYY